MPGVVRMLTHFRWKKAFDDEERALYDQEKLESIRGSSTERHYCVPCGVLFAGLEDSVHCDHMVKQNITDTQLEHPTSFLSPVDDRKSQAVSGGKNLKENTLCK